MSINGLNEVLARGRNRERIEAALKSRDWLIYGAGRAGRSWAAALAADGRQVCGFIDRSANATSPIPVFRVDGCPAELRKKAAVLIAVHNPGVDIAQLLTSLESAGYKNVWLLQDLVDHWPALSNFWLAPSNETLPFTDDIETGWAALADRRSRELFTAILDMRLNGNPGALPAPKLENHYFPDDLPMPVSPINFVDCGAYTGDTIESFRNSGLKFGEIAAFEPDPSHYPKLCKAIEGERAYVFPCGVWGGMTQLRFTTDDSASHINAEGEIVVQTLALDQALPNFPVNYLKMDIEGAEREALLGARKLITANRPRLAISTYHKPRDLWELMLLVREWDLGYEFHVRSHAFNSFETVLYGLPSQ